MYTSTANLYTQIGEVNYRDNFPIYANLIADLIAGLRAICLHRSTMLAIPIL